MIYVFMHSTTSTAHQQPPQLQSPWTRRPTATSATLCTCMGMLVCLPPKAGPSHTARWPNSYGTSPSCWSREVQGKAVPRNRDLGNKEEMTHLLPTVSQALSWLPSHKLLIFVYGVVLMFLLIEFDILGFLVDVWYIKDDPERSPYGFSWFSQQEGAVVWSVKQFTRVTFFQQKCQTHVLGTTSIQTGPKSIPSKPRG